MADQIDIYCILGRTCSGKDTVARLICENDDRFSQIVSYTTRPKRDSETDGVEHYFVSDEEFEELRKKAASDLTNITNAIYDGVPKEEIPFKLEDTIIAYTEIGKYKYMALLTEIVNKHHNVYIIDPTGLIALDNMMYSVNKHSDYVLKVKPVYINSSFVDRDSRARTRSDYDKFQLRCESEDGQFNLFESMIKDYGISIFNNTNNTVVDDLAKLVKEKFLDKYYNPSTDALFERIMSCD